MCSKIDRLSSFLSSSPNMSEPRDTALSDHVKEHEDVGEQEQKSKLCNEEIGKIRNEDGADCKDTVSISSEKELRDDDEGFRTPTSSDHKIPAIVECPPAPKKPRAEPSRLKRKASPPLVCEIDATAEIESMFPLIEEKKPKKARREDKE